MTNNRNLRIITTVITIVLSAGTLLFAQMGTMNQPGNQTSNATTNTTVTEPAAEKAQTHYVSINAFAFSPQTLTIKPGDTVIWTNLETVPHTVTSYNTTKLTLVSPRLSQGQTFSYVFHEKGEFPYRCDIHPSMKGKIIVQ